MASLLNKARKPKFELHLQIYDLNNVPLVSGVSLIKWHLPHSIHGEHRGRTPKCPIANHKVEYNYGTVVPVRIGIDRSNNLSECAIEFEVLQEFSMAGGGGGVGRDEKITLGTIRINLSEYVEESEAMLREGARARRESLGVSPAGEKLRLKKTASTVTATSGSATLVEPSSPKSGQLPELGEDSEVQEGIIRRYLMQDSKINSTLRVGILMIQIDGERNFVAPALKTAPVFGGIASGFIPAEQAEPDEVGQLPSIAKPRDVSELQDMYRRALVASWASAPGELPADECIEDIFAGGNGFRTGSPPTTPGGHAHSHSRSDSRSHHYHSRSGVGGGDGGWSSGSGNGGGGVHKEESGSASGDEADGMGTLRPPGTKWYRHHGRRRSGGSDKSSSGTIVAAQGGGGGGGGGRLRGLGISSPGSATFASSDTRMPASGGLGDGREDIGGNLIRPRAESTASGTTMGSSDRGRDGFKRSREVQETELRDDMVAWQLPGTVS